MRTTQRYYAQIRDSTAHQRLEQAWSKTDPAVYSAKNTIIEKDNYMSGYA